MTNSNAEIRDYSFVTSAFTSERILRDYADKKAVCFASDSGLAIEACDCPQCIEGKLLYPVLSAIAHERRINEIRANVISDLNATIAKVAELVTPLIEDETIEPTSWLGEQLIELLDIELTEEVEVTFTVTYTATLNLPKNANIDDLELEVESYPDVTYRSENVGEARESDSEVSRVC